MTKSPVHSTLTASRGYKSRILIKDERCCNLGIEQGKARRRINNAREESRESRAALVRMR